MLVVFEGPRRVCLPEVPKDTAAPNLIPDGLIGGKLVEGRLREAKLAGGRGV